MWGNEIPLLTHKKINLCLKIILKNTVKIILPLYKMVGDSYIALYYSAHSNKFQCFYHLRYKVKNQQMKGLLLKI